MSSFQSENNTMRKDLARNSVSMEILQLEMNKLSLKLMYIHDIFAATVKYC